MYGLDCWNTSCMITGASTTDVTKLPSICLPPWAGGDPLRVRHEYEYRDVCIDQMTVCSMTIFRFRKHSPVISCETFDPISTSALTACSCHKCLNMRTAVDLTCTYLVLAQGNLRTAKPSMHIHIHFSSHDHSTTVQQRDRQLCQSS